MNGEKTNVMIISMHSTDYDRTKPTGKCKIFQVVGQHHSK
jgi:hypothetical protein